MVAVAGCYGAAADVIVLMDASSSIRRADFHKQVAFIKNVVSGFDVRATSTRVGLVTFSDQTDVMLYLNEYNDRHATMTSLAGARQSQFRGTNTAMALLQAVEMFRLHGRVRAAHVAIVVTAGPSDYPALTAQQADLAKAAGVKVMTVGVGSAVDDSELRSMASTTDDIFTVDDFDALESIRDDVTARACDLQLETTVHKKHHHHHNGDKHNRLDNEVYKHADTARGRFEKGTNS